MKFEAAKKIVLQYRDDPQVANIRKRIVQLTLKQFIDTQVWPANAWVKHPDFSGLYVRKGIHKLNGEMTNTLDLANLTASCPGNGAFSNLVEYLFSTYPDIVLYVENVLNDRFDDKLIRMGFARIGDQRPYCYWKRG